MALEAGLCHDLSWLYFKISDINDGEKSKDITSLNGKSLFVSFSFWVIRQNEWWEDKINQGLRKKKAYNFLAFSNKHKFICSQNSRETWGHQKCYLALLVRGLS